MGAFNVGDIFVALTFYCSMFFAETIDKNKLICTNIQQNCVENRKFRFFAKKIFHFFKSRTIVEKSAKSRLKISPQLCDLTVRSGTTALRSAFD